MYCRNTYPLMQMYRVVPLTKRGNLTNEDVPASIMLYTANQISVFLTGSGRWRSASLQKLASVGCRGIIHTSMMLTVEMYGLQIG